MCDFCCHFSMSFLLNEDDKSDVKTIVSYVFSGGVIIFRHFSVILPYFNKIPKKI